MTASGKASVGLHTFMADVTRGFLTITHSGMALVGLLLTLTVATLVMRPDLREAGEVHLMDWLQARRPAAVVEETYQPEPSDRLLATNPQELPKEQAKVAFWLSKKYRVAPEPLSLLVTEAYDVGRQVKLDPLLILSVMAIESGFNPFAQSPVGAQGLMQVLTRVHTDKYENLGGHLAAFDPVTNMRVGVQILKEYVGRAGSIEGGLKFYVGAGNMDSDGGYAAKVIAEYNRLRSIVGAPPITLAQAKPAPSAPADGAKSAAATPTAAASPSTSPAPVAEQVAMAEEP